MKLRISLLVLVVSFLLPGLVSGVESLTLVSAGKANCVIVTQADPEQGKGKNYGERPLWQVVLDFQRILEKMSGAKIPIVGPDQATGDGVKIYVGSVPLPKKITIDEKGMGPRDYCIIASENALVLRGKTEGGTINAIYGFLQDKLKVRWFFPSELFEVIPLRDTVQIVFCREVHNPSFKGAFFSASAGTTKEVELWCERMRRDAWAFQYQGPTVHYLGYILDSAKYGKTHPEFYPLINGQRLVPPPGRADSAPQPCLSNSDLVKEVVEFCRKAFNDNPNALMVAIGENDNTEWCECDNCKVLDVLPLEKYNNTEQHSDRYFTFANQVARAIAQSHPGKMVGCLAYSGTVTPPRKIDKLEPNVAIGMCLDTSQYYDANYRTKDYNTISVWEAKCKNIVTYDYLSLGWTAPRYYPHMYARHLKEMHKRGVLGMYSEMYPYWATFGPMLYVATQLMWDVNQDPDVILDDLFQGLFDKEAGAEMKAYYDVFEKTWMRPNSNRTGKYFEGWSSLREQMAVYTLADLDEALKHLERAKELAKDPLVRQRIAYIDRSFSYSALLMRGWLTSDQIDATINAGEPQSVEQAKKLHDSLRVVADMVKNEDPVYQKTLLVDPISAKGYYKEDRSGHFGIIRGYWTPRCNYSLRFGLGALLKYYNTHRMASEAAALKGEFPADILQAADAMSGESFGPEIILNGNIEEGTLPVKWEAGGATLSASADSHSGKQSLKIAASIDFGRAVQSFAVKPNTRYRLDCWYKCSRPGGLYYYVAAGGPILIADVMYDNVWTRLTNYFTTPNELNIAKAGLGFCSWPGKDTLIDDVSIREVKSSNLMECKKTDVKFPDWSNPTFALDCAEQLGNDGSNMAVNWRGPEKFSAVACLGWDSQGLRLAVKAKDIDHDQRFKGKDIWNGDSIQFGIDAAADGDKRPFGSGFDDTNDFLYGLTIADRPDSTPELYRWTAPKTKPAGNMLNDGKNHRYSVKVENGNALYDFFVAWDELGVAPKAGDKVGFNLVVFDSYKKESDKSDVLMWLELTPGIAGSAGQSPALWRKFVLTEP